MVTDRLRDYGSYCGIATPYTGKLRTMLWNRIAIDQAQSLRKSSRLRQQRDCVRFHPAKRSTTAHRGAIRRREIDYFLPGADAAISAPVCVHTMQQ